MKKIVRLKTITEINEDSVDALKALAKDAGNLFQVVFKSITADNCSMF